MYNKRPKAATARLAIWGITRLPQAFSRALVSESISCTSQSSVGTLLPEFQGFVAQWSNSGKSLHKKNQLFLVIQIECQRTTLRRQSIILRLLKNCWWEFGHGRQQEHPRTSSLREILNAWKKSVHNAVDVIDRGRGCQTDVPQCHCHPGQFKASTFTLLAARQRG